MEASNATAGTVIGTGTIVKDDYCALAIQDATRAEGDSGKSDLEFTVTLSPASDLPVSVHYQTAAGSATEGSDYAATSGKLDFQPRETAKVIKVPIIGDETCEKDEFFFVNLSQPVGATTVDSRAQGTITNDDDCPPEIRINDVTVTEGDSGTVAANFTVQLSNAVPHQVKVNYATQSGTATAGSDFIAASGQLTFNPGETAKTVTVLVKGDLALEPAPDETFYVNLSSATGAVIVDSQGVGTIKDDDAKLKVWASDASLDEGDRRYSLMPFTISLSRRPDPGQAVVVQYATEDGTAKAPADYEAKSGTVRFVGGATTATVYVKVFGDEDHEGDEYFLLSLSNPASNSPSGVELGPNPARGTIKDDDPAPPAISISDTSVTEGHSGTTDATFQVSLSHATTKVVTVKYKSVNDTATAPSDYKDRSGTLTFVAGTRTLPLKISVKGDLLQEQDEQFYVDLSNPSKTATIGDDRGVGTIIDDDRPRIRINDVTVSEATPGYATFTVSLTKPTSGAVTVKYATADDTATAGKDYTAVAAATLTIPAGVVSKTFNVTILNDILREPTETFRVLLSGPSNNAVLDDATGVGTILDDDRGPALSINDVVVIEGDEGYSDAVFTVSLSEPVTKDVTVKYATRNGSATAGSDYGARSGTLTFGPNELSKSLKVPIIGDKLVESDEDFNVVLSDPTNAVLDGFDSVGVGTIRNDDAYPPDTTTDPPGGDPGDDDDGGNRTCTDPAGCPDFPEEGGSGGGGTNNDSSKPTISIDHVTVDEGEPARFTVTLSKAYDKTVTVSYSTGDGLATAPEDYRAKRGKITFDPGSTSQRVLVTTVNDTMDEPDEEHFYVYLSNPTEATIANGKGRGTIRDNDDPPKILIDDVTVVEGHDAAKPTPAYFRVSLTNPSSFEVAVSYATADGTAKADWPYFDYQSKEDTFTFPPKSLVQWIEIGVLGDKVYEPDEYFTVDLSAPVYATIEDKQAIGTIVNDDPTVNLLIDSNNDGAINSSDDPIEENPPGKFILLNDDDDNNNDVADLSDPGGFVDDDLVPLVIQSIRLPRPFRWMLTFPNWHVRVYRSADRTSEIVSGGPGIWPYPYTDPLPSTLYVEGLNPSLSFGDTTIVLNVALSDERILSDKVVATVVRRPDLDIDSDNNNRLEPPDRSLAEDRIEDDATQLGKIVGVNNNNDDGETGDEIPDFADGFNWDGTPGNDDDQTANEAFVPLILELFRPINWAYATLTVTYDASNPSLVTRSGTEEEGFHYEPAPGHLRLWTTNGSTPRTKLSVRNKTIGDNSLGFYVPPGDYSGQDLARLGFSDSTLTVTLYIEGIDSSTELGDQRISVQLNPSGPVSIPELSDAVRVTVIGLEFLRGDIDPESGRGAIGSAAQVLHELTEEDNPLPATDPAPHVVLENLVVSNVTLNANRRLVANVQLSGYVTSALADIVPGNQADPTTATIFVDGMQVGTAALARVAETPALLRPYAARYTFSASLIAAPVQSFDVPVMVEVEDPATGNIGWELAKFTVVATRNQSMPGDGSPDSESMPLVVRGLSQPLKVQINFGSFRTLDEAAAAGANALSVQAKRSYDNSASLSKSASVQLVSGTPPLIRSGDQDVQIRITDTSTLGLQLDQLGKFTALVTIPNLYSGEIAVTFEETSAASNVFVTRYVEAVLTLSGPLSSGANDTVGVQVRKTLWDTSGAWVAANLTETGADTKVFGTGGFVVSIAAMSGTWRWVYDEVVLSVSNSALGLSRHLVDTAETGLDSKVFRTDSVLSLRPLETDYADAWLNGPWQGMAVTQLEGSNPGPYVPLMVRIRGPLSLANSGMKVELFGFEHALIVREGIVFSSGSDDPGVFATAGRLKDGQTFGAGHVSKTEGFVWATLGRSISGKEVGIYNTSEMLYLMMKILGDGRRAARLGSNPGASYPPPIYGSSDDPRSVFIDFIWNDYFEDAKTRLGKSVVDDEVRRLAVTLMSRDDPRKSTLGLPNTADHVYARAFLDKHICTTGSALLIGHWIGSCDDQADFTGQMQNVTQILHWNTGIGWGTCNRPADYVLAGHVNLGLDINDPSSFRRSACHVHSIGGWSAAGASVCESFVRAACPCENSVARRPSRSTRFSGGGGNWPGVIG